MGTRNTKIINILAKNVIDIFLEMAKSFMLKIFREALEVKYSQTNAAITANMCISPLQRPHYFTSSYTYLFSKKVILLSFLGCRIA